MAGSCPPPHILEAIATRGAYPSQFRAHAEGCSSCRTQIDEIRANQDFLNNAAPFLVAASDSVTTGESSGGPRLPAIPGFLVQEEISRGGQGVVYRAVQIATKRPAAVKMLLAGAFATQRQRLRFDREIELAAKLRHPNIVSVFESGQSASGCPFVAMEFVAGIPLDVYALRNFPPPGERSRSHFKELARLLARVAAAVGAAHTSGVIHRDLKPSNVIVDETGNPRVLDFGLARPTETLPDVTITQEFAGTPIYAAPEQFRADASAVDARTDVYSLGVMFYRVLTSAYPYPCDGTIADVARHVGQSAPTPPAKFAPRIPKDLETIVLKCLSKESDRRYANASALEADLQHYLHDRAIDARRDSAFYMLQKAVGQNRRLLGAALVIAAILLGNVYFLAHQQFNARASRLKADLEQQRADAEATRSDATAYIMRNLLPRDLFPDGRANPAGTLAFQHLMRVENQLEMGAFAQQPQLELALRSTLGAVLADSPHLAGQGEISVRHSLSSRLRVYGPDHPESATGYHQLAEVLLARRRYAEALDACRRALAIRERAMDQSDAAPAASLELLARILIRSGDPRGAADAASRALLTLSGPRLFPRQRAATLRTAAEARAALGEIDAAKRLAGDALSLALAELADDDGVLEACVLQSAALGVSAGTGGNAPDMPALLSRLRSGFIGESPHQPHSNRLAELLRLRQALLDPNHPAICRNLTGLASQFAAEERFDAAIGCFIESLPMLESQFGPSQISVANCCEQIGVRYGNVKCYREAAEYTGRSRDIWLQQPDFARDELSIAAATRYVGWYAGLAGDWPAAELQNREAIERFRRLLAPDHYAIAMATAQLAWSLAEQGQIREAEALVCQAYEAAAAHPALPADQSACVKCIRGLILVRAGLPDDGALLLAEGIEFYWPMLDTHAIEPFVEELRRVYERREDFAALDALHERWSELIGRRVR